MEDVLAAAAAASAAGKLRRCGDDELRWVAEIVMVLAAAGEVRGGREPTAAERALAAEAQERLAAAVAEGAVRPNDLFPVEAVRAVLDDLGLNRAKDSAAMGFRPPKASIADRLMLTKRKMEEVKEAPARPISTTQAVVSIGMSEFQVLHGASKFSVGVPRNPPPAAAPLNSASFVTLKLPGSSPVKPVTNSAAHLKLEKDVNGPLNLAHSGANIVHSVESSPDTSASPNVNAVQSSNQVVKNQDTKPVVVQAVTGNPVPVHHATPGVAYFPPKSPFVHHNYIAKIVQQFLHQPTNHPSWTLPSAEYMHSRLCCQICKVVTSDVDGLLVCDACERGVHLICLHNYGNKGVPKAEWHCSVCLTQSKGKPLPPKYGKVTRTAIASKAPPPVNGPQSALQRLTETMATKVNHHKLAANANPTKPNSTQASSTIHNSNVLALRATTAGSQLQLVSTLKPSVGSAVKSEASSNGKGRTGQPCSSTVQSSMNSPLNKRLKSDSSLNSADSANNIVHGKKTEVSGVKYADNYFSVDATNFKSEAHAGPLLSTYEEMVDHSETEMEDTRNLATEERPRTQAAFEPEKTKYVGTTTNTGTATTNEGTKLATEEKLQSKTNSEPPTMTDVMMDVPTGKPIYQNSNVAIEKKFKTDAASDIPVDQSNNLANKEKHSEQSSALNDGGIPTHQSEHINALNGNGLQESPCGDKSKSGCDAALDHDSIQTVAANGVLHTKNEMLCVSENETVGGCQ